MNNAMSMIYAIIISTVDCTRPAQNFISFEIRYHFVTKVLVQGISTAAFGVSFPITYFGGQKNAESV